MTNKTIALILVALLTVAGSNRQNAIAKCVGCDKTKEKLQQEVPEPSPPPVAPPIPAPALHTGTSSTTLQSGTDSTMLQTGTDSTTLQTGTDSTTLQTGTDSTLIQAGVKKETVPLNILILFDCSQSMKEGMTGLLASDKQDKMDAAKHSLEAVLQSIPTDIAIGLRVFGQSFNNYTNPCEETALLVPIGKGNRRTIVERMRQMHPFGMTPLTYALREAQRDFEAIDPREQKQIILISDGADTCNGDPCELVRRLTELGYHLKIDIVGLGLARDRQAKAQLNCVSSQSGGKYYDANTAGELIDSIRKSVKEAVSGRVMTKLKPGVMQQLPADLRP